MDYLCGERAGSKAVFNVHGERHTGLDPLKCHRSVPDVSFVQFRRANRGVVYTDDIAINHEINVSTFMAVKYT